MKVFVGTLHSGEAEFEECCESVRSQQNVEVYQYVISGLPQQEAHAALLSAWNEAAPSFDVFVKVDADTILQTPMILSGIATLLTSRSGPTIVQIPLQDYFTDKPICGLNAFSSEVRFELDLDARFTDRAGFTPAYRFTANEYRHLIPVGLHGKCPHFSQAFFFGLHRMQKKQYDTFHDVAKAWKHSGGTGREYALYGAVAALCYPHLPPDYSPSFKIFQDHYQEHEALRRRLLGIMPFFCCMGDSPILRRGLSKFFCNIVIPYLFTPYFMRLKV